MREIPALSILCLRAVGSQRCSAEDTFAKTTGPPPAGTSKDAAGTAAGAASKDNKSDSKQPDSGPKLPSTASRLLQSFHDRPATLGGSIVAKDNAAAADDETTAALGISSISIPRTPAIGDGSARRKQANDLDLNHPWIAVYQTIDEAPTKPNAAAGAASNDPADEEDGEDDVPMKVSPLPSVPSDPDSQMLVTEYGSAALDLLQSYIDSLVELGRMDDNRLGLHFFQEIKANIELSRSGDSGKAAASSFSSAPPPAKKKKTSRTSATPTAPSAYGSLSFHNANFLDETLSNLIQSQVLSHIAVLDLTGVSTLNDDMLQQIAAAAGPQLQRLSVKNCRRLTNASVTNLALHCPNLISIDIGGAYNITPQCVLDSLSPLQSITNNNKDSASCSCLPELIELHASGLGWNDTHLKTLFSLRAWQGLSVGFSPLLTFAGWKDAVWADSSEGMCNNLQSLAVPFCEGLVDNAWMGMMGRHVPHLRALDVRGNTGITSMTGWYDGRATIVPSVPLIQSLIVLARYSNITKSSVEDTKRVHPAAALPLNVVLDSGGVGLGILRLEKAVAATCHRRRRAAADVTSSKRKRSTTCSFSVVPTSSTTHTKTSSSPVFSACDLDTDKPSNNRRQQTSLLSFFSKKNNPVERKLITPLPKDAVRRIESGSDDECQSVNDSVPTTSGGANLPAIVDPSPISTSTRSQPFIKAVPTKKKTLTQVYLDCGQSKFGQVLCSKCGVLYTPGLPEDEKQHKQLCQAYKQGIHCITVASLGKVVEQAAPEHGRQYSILQWKAGTTSKIPSQWPLLAQMISRDLGMNEAAALQHLKEQSIYLYVGKALGGRKNGGNILGVATVQSISQAFVMSSLHDRELSPSKAMLGIGILWTHHSARHQGIATTLVNAARDHSVFGMRVEKSMVAFSSPTQAGYDFAIDFLYGGKSNGEEGRDDQEKAGPLVYEM